MGWREGVTEPLVTAERCPVVSSSFSGASGTACIAVMTGASGTLGPVRGATKGGIPYIGTVTFVMIFATWSGILAR